MSAPIVGEIKLKSWTNTAGIISVNSFPTVHCGYHIEPVWFDMTGNFLKASGVIIHTNTTEGTAAFGVGGHCGENAVRGTCQEKRCIQTCSTDNDEPLTHKPELIASKMSNEMNIAQPGPYSLHSCIINAVLGLYLE